MDTVTTQGERKAMIETLLKDMLQMYGLSYKQCCAELRGEVLAVWKEKFSDKDLK